jgi:hypothetical protein
MERKRKATELERAWNMLDNHGYIPTHIRENSEGGVVMFFDPHTMEPTWPGDVPVGRVRFTATELRALRSALDAKARIFARVRQAELDLLERLQRGKGLAGLGVSLILALSVVYPLASLAS